MRIEIQKDVNGCGIACLATIVGASYDELAAEWRKQHGDFASGIYPDELHRFLWASGFFIQRRYCPGSESQKLWRPIPFAPIHMVEVVVKVVGKSHYVLMDGSGRLFDPIDGSERSMEHYDGVNRIEGIIKPLLVVKG